MRTPTIMNQWIRFCLVGRIKIIISMVSTYLSNENIFLGFSPRCMARSVRRIYLYSRIWVNSWRKNSRNQLHISMVGSTDISQSQLQGCTPALSVDLAPPIPCRNGIRTGYRDWASVWRNKSRAIIIFHAHPITILYHPRDPTLVWALRARSSCPLTETFYFVSQRKDISV